MSNTSSTRRGPLRSIQAQDGTRTSAESSNSKSKKLVPAASFADVLEQLGKAEATESNPTAEGVTQSRSRWPRPPRPNIKSASDTFAVHITDLQEGICSKTGESTIQMFGITMAQNSVLIHVYGFQHYFYYPSPESLELADLNRLRDYINDVLGKTTNLVSRIEFEELSIREGGDQVKLLKIYVKDYRQLPLFFTSAKCEYRDLFQSPANSHEGNLTYLTRFMVDTKILPMTWVRLLRGKYRVFLHRVNTSRSQVEVAVDLQDLQACDVANASQKCPPLRILSFDLECNVRKGTFPTPQHDPVFQIANMVSIFGEKIPSIRNVFTLKSCSPIVGSQVLSYPTEKQLLDAWRDFFLEVDPDIVIGYNITQFDIPYLRKRAVVLGLDRFGFLGRMKTQAQPIMDSPTFNTCPGYEGRILLDVYFHIREHYPGRRGPGPYKLNTVAWEFLKERKEDIHYSQIPVLQNGNADTRRALAIYCLKDVYLPLRLFEKLKCLQRVVELAQKECMTMDDLRMKSGLRGLAQRYTQAFENGYVIGD